MDTPTRPRPEAGRGPRGELGAVRLESRGDRRPSSPKWDARSPRPGGRSMVRWIVLAVALALLGFLVYRQISRSLGARVEIPVAAADLDPETRLGPENLTTATVREKDLPQGVAMDPASLEGRRLARGKEAGAPFFRQDLAPPDMGPGLAGLLPEGRLLVFLRLGGIPMDELVAQLRFGDRFDVVAVGPIRGGGRGAVSVAHDAYFVGWIAPRPEERSDAPSGAGLGSALTEALAAGADQGGGGGDGSTSLLLAVRPADAVNLTEAQAAGAPLSLVLHGRDEVAQGDLLTLPRVELTQVEVIRGGNRETVPLQRPERR